MINYLWVGFVFLLLYFLPGWSFSRLFRGRLKNSPYFILFLSFLVLPVIYTLLLFFNQVNIWAFSLAALVFWLLCFCSTKTFFKEKTTDLETLIPTFKPSSAVLVSAVLFFLIVMSPRLGLWQGFFPIGDDQHQIRKIVSVAESPSEPLFYHFPTTRLTIYYFNNIGPGLWVRFSKNAVKVNQAWFIHLALETLILLWLIIRVGGSLFKTNFPRFIFFFALTFFSGLEFYLFKIKGLDSTNQLEWWSDWFWPKSQIHMQISNPSTLFFWVPQHLWAALLVLVTFILGRSTEKGKVLSQVFLAFLWTNILGNSAFVFLTSVLVYGFHLLIQSLTGKDFKKIIRENGLVFFLALFFSARNLILFATAEKSQYLVPMANVFWFANNSNFWGKVTNLSLTIPLYFLIEFGFLLLVLIWSLRRFRRDPVFREKYLFFYLFIFLMPVIFFVKALDDNNISMRAFIPAQIALALFAAELLNRPIKKRLWQLTIAGGILLSLPSGLFDFSLRFREQFPAANDANYSFYQTLDRDLPLNSIVFGPYTEVGKISGLGHRLTFKDPNLFNATDREHTARSRVEKYDGLDLSSEEGIAEVLKGNFGIKREFRFYSLRPLSGARVLTGKKLFSVGDLTLYPVSVDASEIKL